MPTRPARRERRRADRRNANKLADPVSCNPMLPSMATMIDPDPQAPKLFISAVPIVRKVMRLILIQASFASSQVVGFAMWKEALELENRQSSAPHYDQHEYQILCFDAIIELHEKHMQHLHIWQLEYARQVMMWGFECSKAEEEWDMRFIARRKLELAQLNRVTKKLAISFENKLQGLLKNKKLFSSKEERQVIIGTLERFRDSFSDGLEVADKETAAALEDL